MLPLRIDYYLSDRHILLLRSLPSVAPRLSLACPHRPRVTFNCKRRDPVPIRSRKDEAALDMLRQRYHRLPFISNTTADGMGFGQDDG